MVNEVAEESKIYTFSIYWVSLHSNSNLVLMFAIEYQIFKGKTLLSIDFDMLQLLTINTASMFVYDSN